MTAFNYTRIKARASALISRFGFAATLEKPGTNIGQDYDPVYGAATTSTITVVDESIRTSDPTGQLTGVTRRVLTVSTDGLVPTKGDRVQVRSAWHEIDAVRPLAPGGVDLLFEVELVT